MNFDYESLLQYCKDAALFSDFRVRSMGKAVFGCWSRYGILVIYKKDLIPSSILWTAGPHFLFLHIIF